jgi:hypothetical protein
LHEGGWGVGFPLTGKRVRQSQRKEDPVSLVVILLLVIIVLALLGFFGRGFRRV